MIRSAAEGPRLAWPARRAGKGDHVRVIVAATIAATIVLSACGGDGAGGGGGAGAGDLGPAVETDSVTVAEGRKFEPASIVVSVGTTVTWTNKDKASHTITAGLPGKKTGEFDRTLSPSREGVGGAGEFTFKFDKPGIYTYYCQFHTTMIGQVEVK